MVEHVEEFGPKLHIEGIRDTSYVIILEQRNIKIKKSRSSQDVAPGIAHQCFWIWKCETFSLNKMFQVAGICQRLATRSRENVGNVHTWSRTFHSQGIPRNSRCKWHASHCLKYST